MSNERLELVFAVVLVLLIIGLVVYRLMERGAL